MLDQTSDQFNFAAMSGETHGLIKGKRSGNKLTTLGDSIVQSHSKDMFVPTHITCRHLIKKPNVLYL